MSELPQMPLAYKCYTWEQEKDFCRNSASVRCARNTPRVFRLRVCVRFPHIGTLHDVVFIRGCMVLALGLPSCAMESGYS